MAGALCRFKTRIRLLNWAFTESRSSVVLVDQPAKHRPTTHLPARGRRRGPARRRRLLIEGLVRPMPVVAAGVLVQHHRQVPPAGDQEPVSALAACRSHPPLRVRVRPGSLRRGLHHLHPAPARTVSNAVVYLASRSRIRNRNDRPASSRSATRLRAHCVTHAPLGCLWGSRTRPRALTWASTRPFRIR